MFKGTYHHRIDPKGRLPVPAVFAARSATAGAASVVVTQLDQCLAVYPPAEWARLEAQLAALPAFNKQVKALTRLLASRAADCELDVQGRILLPPTLRQAAGLDARRGRGGRAEPLRDLVARGLGRVPAESERLLDDVSLDIQWPPAPPVPAVGPGRSPTPPRQRSSTGKPKS